MTSASSTDKTLPGQNASGLPFSCGDFDMRIDREGRWYYRNSPIGRIALVKLFATVLRRDDDGVYWLTTPAENGIIEVEDVPFIGVKLDVENPGPDQCLHLTTNLDDRVTISAEHPLHLGTIPQTNDQAPYVHIRKGLLARLNRPTFYQLVDMAEPDPELPDTLGIRSSGVFFSLGTAK